MQNDWQLASTSCTPVSARQGSSAIILEALSTNPSPRKATDAPSQPRSRRLHITGAGHSVPVTGSEGEGVYTNDTSRSSTARRGGPLSLAGLRRGNTGIVPVTSDRLIWPVWSLTYDDSSWVFWEGIVGGIPGGIRVCGTQEHAAFCKRSVEEDGRGIVISIWGTP